MTEPIGRVVDAHVHHWDPTRVDWYPFLASDDALKDLGMSDVSAVMTDSCAAIAAAWTG